MTDIDSNTLCNTHDLSPSTGLDRRAHLVFGDQHELRLFSKMYCAYYCKTRRMQGLTSACVCGQIHTSDSSSSTCWGVRVATQRATCRLAAPEECRPLGLFSKPGCTTCQMNAHISHFNCLAPKTKMRGVTGHPQFARFLAPTPRQRASSFRPAPSALPTKGGRCMAQMFEPVKTHNDRLRIIRCVASLCLAPGANSRIDLSP
jgi:hypothetical protein